MTVYRVSGNNDFQDGWIAHLLGESDDEGRSVNWRIGWDTGADTPSVALIATVNRLSREQGQLIVVKEPE